MHTVTYHVLQQQQIKLFSPPFCHNQKENHQKGGEGTIRSTETEHKVNILQNTNETCCRTQVTGHVESGIAATHQGDHYQLFGR